MPTHSKDRRLFGLAVICAALYSGVAFCDDSSRQTKTHHTRDGFRNLRPQNQPGFLGFLKWRWDRIWQDIPDPQSFRFPMAKNDPAYLRANHTETTLTWIGHATVLLQLKGKNILTDPHFSQRASPVQWAGPQRVVPSGLKLTDLPPIHIVVISHDHYDSLDTASILSLFQRRDGDKTTFFVPLGLKPWFERLGITRVVQLDWWDRYVLDGMEVIAVPVHHWSKRLLESRNKTLWAGWVVRTPDFRFFFAGDSGYDPLFKEIGRRYGPFDLAAVPIGAYEPRWFMRYHHMSPEEAVQVHVDVASKKSVAIHWGTFMLTDEPLDEPPKRLKEALRTEGLSPDEFVALKHGETIMLHGSQ